MSTWLPVVAAAIGAGGASGVIGSLATGLFARPKTKADAVKVLTEAALAQVNELQERTAAAEAAADAAAQKIRALSQEVDMCTAKLRYWRAAILSPAASLPALRDMVSEPGVNGR